MLNRYVDFVSDEDFLECVKWVCDAYPTSDEVDLADLQRNTIDPFKMTFDMVVGSPPFDTWIKTEEIRQRDKTINNRIGEFHQKLLGKVNGWTDLGVGDDTHVDIKKNDNSIFIELKNKFNTMNDDATNQCWDKLERATRNYPRCKAFWAFVISKNGNSGEEQWIKKGKTHNEQVRKIWGRKVYELVTGSPDSLDKVWVALPIAINDVLDKDEDISEQDVEKMKGIFDTAFTPVENLNT